MKTNVKDKWTDISLFLDYDSRMGASGTIIAWDGSDKAKPIFVSDN